MKIPMNKKYRRGLVMDPASASLQPVDRNHYVQQWIYGAVEPAILKVTDFMYNDPVRTKLYNKLATPKALPREVVCSTEAVCRFIDFIYSAEADNDCPRMAVTKCVCQTATDTYAEPVWKDMALLYTANLYTTVKHTAIGEPYHIIETAEEAKKMIRQFDADRLIHTIMYCHGNGRWTFVVCNCDDTICVPMKAYLGPLQVRRLCHLRQMHRPLHVQRERDRPRRQVHRGPLRLHGLRPLCLDLPHRRPHHGAARGLPA